MTTTSERNQHLDALALGSRCFRCGAETDEPCRTARGAETVPHAARIDRAVSQWQAAREAASRARVAIY